MGDNGAYMWVSDILRMCRFQKHINKLSACNPLSKAPKNEVRLLCDEAMSARIREAQAVAELKDTKQRVMEMETQVHYRTITS